MLKLAEFVRRRSLRGSVVLGIEGNHDRTNGGYWLRVCGIDPLGQMGDPDYVSFKNERVPFIGIDFERSEDVLSQLDDMADIAPYAAKKYRPNTTFRYQKPKYLHQRKDIPLVMQLKSKYPELIQILN